MSEIVTSVCKKFEIVTNVCEKFETVTSVLRGLKSALVFVRSGSLKQGAFVRRSENVFTITLQAIF